MPNPEHVSETSFKHSQRTKDVLKTFERHILFTGKVHGNLIY